VIVGDRVDSVGRCSRCGYEGPGPRHDCPDPLVTPETLTDHAIPLRRTHLTLQIIEMERERHDCVLALGGDAMHEDAEPRDASARQRICDAINARKAGGS